MDPLFIHQFNKFSQQLGLINEYIELKFGADFKEFLTFKASRPNVGMIVVPNDGSHHHNNVDICGVINNDEEDPEDFKNQREDEEEIEIGDQGVSIDWGQDGPPPIVTNVFELEPEDISVPAFDDDDYENNDQDDCDEDENIPSSFYQSYNGRYHYQNGDDNDDEGEEGDESSSAVFGHRGDESMGFFNNQDDDNQDSFGISPIPTTITPNNPTTIRRRRKKTSINPPPKGRKGVKKETIKKIRNVTNPFRVSNEVTDSKEPLRHATWGITYIGADRKNGADRLVYDNYIFRPNKFVRPSGRTYWVCAEKTCPVRVAQDYTGRPTFSNHHTHLPPSSVEEQT